MDPTRYFGDRVDDYARWRPGYPDAAIAHSLDGVPQTPRVIELGSGTGIAARAFASAGADVVGVEPDSDMRSRAASHASPPRGSLRYIEGTAEATGLADNTADVVVAAQAFHWFDAERALAEAHRLLVPGGRLALVWNVRRRDTPFMAVYAEVVSGAQAHAEQGGRRVSRSRVASPDQSKWFVAATHFRCPNTQDLPWEGIVGRLSSASYFPATGSLRDALLARLERAFREHAGPEGVPYAQDTEVTLARAST